VHLSTKGLCSWTQSKGPTLWDSKSLSGGDKFKCTTHTAQGDELWQHLQMTEPAGRCCGRQLGWDRQSRTKVIWSLTLPKKHGSHQIKARSASIRVTGHLFCFLTNKLPSMQTCLWPLGRGVSKFPPRVRTNLMRIGERQSGGHHASATLSLLLGAVLPLVDKSLSCLG
jgi:hypothetical protein